MRLCGLAVCLLLAWSGPVGARLLEVHNLRGGIKIVVGGAGATEVEVRGVDREIDPGDLQRIESASRTILKAQPDDGPPLDLEVTVPVGYDLDAETKDGDLSLTGMLPRVRMWTETGAIRLELPWNATRMTFDSEEKPAEVRFPPGRRFLESVVDLAGGRTLWRLRDGLSDKDITYGFYTIRAKAPRAVELAEFQPPDDWPLRFHWEAEAELETLIDSEKNPRQSQRRAPRRAAEGEPDPAELEAMKAAEAVFRSDVRMANFTLSVSDGAGGPLTGLKAEDFHVLEDGVEQEVSFAGSDDVPFNLAVLLDLSGSAQPDRIHLQAAAKRFIEMTRPGDRVALYALSDAMFQVVSPLTSDREALLESIQRLPAVSGPTPLYDVLTLAYVQDLAGRSGERNALVVISDGIDNQVSKQQAPSSVKLKKLVKAAEDFDAIFYPVVLLSGERFGRNWSAKGRENLADLADATGGRLFTARSVRDLEPVFPQIESELRSVYSVAYYPKDQDFDGGWRVVKIQVDRRGAQVRARPGYFAR